MNTVWPRLCFDLFCLFPGTYCILNSLSVEVEVIAEGCRGTRCCVFPVGEVVIFGARIMLFGLCFGVEI